MQFIGRKDTSQFFDRILSMLQLLDLFWLFNLLQKIVMETNCYATYLLDAAGNIGGGV
jgi:hypothetical protein